MEIRKYFGNHLKLSARLSEFVKFWLTEDCKLLQGIMFCEMIKISGENLWIMKSSMILTRF